MTTAPAAPTRPPPEIHGTRGRNSRQARESQAKEVYFLTMLVSQERRPQRGPREPHRDCAQSLKVCTECIAGARIPSHENTPRAFCCRSRTNGSRCKEAQHQSPCPPSPKRRPLPETQSCKRTVTDQMSRLLQEGGRWLSWAHTGFRADCSWTAYPATHKSKVQHGHLAQGSVVTATAVWGQHAEGHLPC